ncbi:ATP12 family protein [Parvularcula dongshanensis]|uniref:Chaperone required for assembly of F1-ATPase n=1 Tax=Parvularcula dongshanensis TaxID=1173995 RepID=A0A840I4J5_9PROT|nr:ATP12 family protein [Parvularcula dongshanensis]MBB4659193.1 chaperone required for assembly of F1-ATPase [Parvularcula dongshanensis]
MAGPVSEPAKVRRFYEAAGIEAEGDAYAVTLDGRRARSPGRRVLAGPLTLAEAMAAEWAGQGETLDMASMPLTRLHGQFLDADDEQRAAWGETVVAYAGSDLLCYRGDDRKLAARQAEVWQPFLDEIGDAAGDSFAVTEGIMAVGQPEGVLSGVRGLVADLSEAHRFAARHLTEITGSAVLALAAIRGADPDAVFAASRLDETFQAERWGVDAEAAAREAARRRDFGAVVRYAALTA